jgi:hypothetical protein
MGKRLILQGFQITPVLGILDEDGDTLAPAPLPTTHLPPDGLDAFVAGWPEQLARLRADFAAQQRDAAALGAIIRAEPAPPSRPTRRRSKRPT